jgi:hypothetical protein
MRRIGPVLIWLVLACSACADPSPSAPDQPVTARAASSSSSAPSVPTPTDTLPLPPSGSPAAEDWTGPVRAPSMTGVPMDRDGSGGFASQSDDGDAALAYADIERATVDNAGQPHWRLSLAAKPPEAAMLDPAQTVISYGLAFETTGDGTPDYVVGISNEGSARGDFLVWVTDLATGETEEQDGPPYGFPVEFAHPDEGEATGMLFTFLGGSRPPGITLSTPFYAWASIEEEGEVVAWD